MNIEILGLVSVGFAVISVVVNIIQWKDQRLSRSLLRSSLNSIWNEHFRIIQSIDHISSAQKKSEEELWNQIEKSMGSIRSISDIGRDKINNIMREHLRRIPRKENSWDPIPKDLQKVKREWPFTKRKTDEGTRLTTPPDPGTPNGNTSNVEQS